MKYAKFATILLLSAAMSAQTAQPQSKAAKAPKKSQPAAVSAADVNALREAIAQQQQQIAEQQKQLQQLKDELQRRDEAAQQRLQDAQAAATDTKAKVAELEASKAKQDESVAKIQTDMADVRTSLASTAGELQDAQKAKPNMEAGFGKIKFGGLIQVWGLAGNQGQKDTFRLRRTELKFTGNFSPQLSWTVMIEPTKALSMNNTTTKINGTTVLTGTSVNQSSRILSDAFMTFDYIPRIRVNVGQYRIPLGNEGFMGSSGLDTVERALFMTASNKIADLRDLGVMINAPSKYVDAWVGAFNGSGDRQNDVAVNDQKAIVGRLVFKPVKGFQFGGSGVFGNGGSRPDRPRRDRLGAEISYKNGPWTFRSEWMEGKDAFVLRQGYYIHTGYMFKKKFEPIFRFDTFDPDVSHLAMTGSNVPERDYVTGFNYLIPDSHLKLQLNYTRRTFARDLVTSKNLVVANIQTSW